MGDALWDNGSVPHPWKGWEPGRFLTVMVRIERGVALPVGSRLNVVVFVMALAFRFYVSYQVYFDNGIGGSRENGGFLWLRREVV